MRWVGFSFESIGMGFLYSPPIVFTKKLKNYLAFPVLLIAMAPLWSQDRNLSINQLEEDIKICRGVLESMHGGLYRYRTKVEIDQSFTALESATSQSMTDLTFFRLLSPVIAKIQCGHTGIVAPKAVRDRIFREGKLLPMQLYFHREKAYFVKSFTEESIPINPGEEILAVNGISMDSLINYSLTVNSVGDGWIKTGKLNLLNRVFSRYFALYFSQPDEYTITYTDGSKEVETLTVKALVGDDMVNLSPNEPEMDRHIDLSFYSEATARLRVKSFDNWKEGKKKVKFHKYLQNVFQRIDSSNVSNLIIDVRDNGGGDDEMGLALFSYLHHEPLIEFDSIAFKTKKLHYAKHSDFNRLKFWVAKALNKYKRINDSTYHIVNATTKPHPPGEPQFSGKLVVLINGRSFSTTADFAALTKSYDKAILVGEETSGGYYGNTSGATFTYTLPNSGIKIIVPFMGYWTNVRGDVAPGRGTIPEYQVVPSVHDILAGRDVQMDFALELLAEEK